MAVFSIIQKSRLEGAHRLDAEYFQPQYLEIEKKLMSTSQDKRWGEIEGKFITGPFGSEFNVENYTSNSDYRYIRGKDVKQFFLEDDDNVNIPEKDFQRLNKYSLHVGDILISVVGTNGNTVVVDKSVPPAIFSCKSTAFRTKAINPFYFIAFLNSRYGQQQLERSVRGALQTGLNIDDLKSALVYTPSQQEQEKIGTLIENAKAEYEQSKNLYLRAESLLLEELGLKDNIIRDDLSFVVKLSDVTEARRLDAEYFQPKYEKLIEKIKAHGGRKLGELVTMKKGIEPGAEVYQDEGKLFIRVSSLSKLGLTERDQKYLTDDYYQKLKSEYEPEVGELLLTKDAAPGVAYVLKEPVEGIIAGGVLRLKVKSAIEPEYLALCLNSVVGKMQAERDAGGSVIAHWKPEEIRNVLIPMPPQELQKKIASLLIQSFESQKRSKQLLEQAKQEVEEMIEGRS